jgi:hypothetical protein
MKVIPWIVVVLVVAFAIRRRLRGGGSARAGVRSPKRSDGGAASRLFGVTGLIAAREIRQRVRGKVFRLATLVILIGVAAAILIPAVHKSKASVLRVGVVGTLAAPVKSAINTTADALGTKAHVVT